jgi:hypothetical protein
MSDFDSPEFSIPRRFASLKNLNVAKLRAVLTKSSSNRGFERYRRAGITASSSFIAKALNIFISFLSVPLTIHYLGSERYGVWLTISSLLTWMALTDFGLSGNALVNVLAESSGNDDMGTRTFCLAAGHKWHGVFEPRHRCCSKESIGELLFGPLQRS